MFFRKIFDIRQDILNQESFALETFLIKTKTEKNSYVDLKDCDSDISY